MSEVRDTEPALCVMSGTYACMSACGQHLLTVPFVTDLVACHLDLKNCVVRDASGEWRLCPGCTSVLRREIEAMYRNARA